jgi:hypothetical protein
MPAATDRVTEKPLLLAIAHNEVLKRSFLPFCQQPEFPGERVDYKAVKVIPLRHPGKQFANARGLRHDRHHMTGATELRSPQLCACSPLDRLDRKRFSDRTALRA